MGSGPPSKPARQPSKPLTEEERELAFGKEQPELQHTIEKTKHEAEEHAEEQSRKYEEALEENRKSDEIYNLHKAYSRAILLSKNDEDMMRNVKPALLKLINKIPFEDREDAYAQVWDARKFWSGAELINAVKATLRAINDDFVEEAIDPGKIQDRAYLHIKRKGWNRKSLSYIQLSDTVSFVFYPKIPEGKELDFKDKAAWREDYYRRHKWTLGRTLSPREHDRYVGDWDMSNFKTDPRSSYAQMLRRQAEIKKSDLAKAELEFDRFMQDEGIGIDQTEREEQWEAFTLAYRNKWKISLNDLPIPEQYVEDTRLKRAGPDEED